MAGAAFTTRPATQDPSGGLRLVPSPLGRTLVTESGEPFLAVGDHLGISWAYTRQLYPGDVWDSANNVYQNFHENLPIEGHYDAYFDELQARGVNTMRVFIEQPGTQSLNNPSMPYGTYWLENNVDQFNSEMRQFLDTVIEEADERGMYIVLSAFSTWYYREAFGAEGPWSTNFGGPLTDIDDFFQHPGTLDIAKNRMAEVVTWVRESAHPERVMGYEIINEWNGFRWTENEEGDGSADRAAEVATRAVWMGELARHTRSLDPERLVINPIIGENRGGGVARSLFYSRDFDVLMPHFYTLANEEPINNPSSDRAFQAGVEQARTTAMWLNMAHDRKPILNGEWGPARESWVLGTTYYTDKEYREGFYTDEHGTFTLAEDEDLYSAVVWAGLASGQFGTG
ncbi:MAG: glycoside hydrolase family 5 protein, partial [Phycisphaerales bacterium]|nr:glycoside hydrolase family 5 protein [Phycisphaerales bacterium]